MIKIIIIFLSTSAFLIVVDPKHISTFLRLLSGLITATLLNYNKILCYASCLLFPKYISKYFIRNILYPRSPSLQSLSPLSTDQRIPQNHTTSDKDYNCVCVLILFHIVSLKAFLHLVIYVKLAARSKREERDIQDLLLDQSKFILGQFVWPGSRYILTYPIPMSQGNSVTQKKQQTRVSLMLCRTKGPNT